ncbi:MAG: type II secretion system protein [Gemmatimonadaceae bacterium]
MSRHSGFTLIEVIAAISIIGFALAGAIALLDQLGDSSARIVREGLRTTREANGTRLLRRLLIDASATTDSARRFRGDENTVEFWTRCDVPGGWAEECRASLSIDRTPDSSIVLADVPGGGRVAVDRRSGSAVLRYYHPSVNADTLWANQWSSNVALPAAIALVMRGDTIVFPVGPSRE